MAGSTEGSYAEKETQPDGSLLETMTEAEKEQAMEDLQKISMVDGDLASLILNSGYTSLKALSEAKVDRLSEINELDEDQAQQIITDCTELLEEADEGNPGTAESKGDDALAQWLTGESDNDLGGVLSNEIKDAKEKGVTKKEEDMGDVEEEEGYEALKSWLTGEEDSFSEWLGEETFEEEREELEEEIAEKEDELKESRAELETKMQQTDALKEKLEERLQDIEAGEFDIQEIIQENEDLSQEIEELESKIDDLKDEKEELEQEVDEIKQGSVAMLKYIKTQKMKGGGEIQEGEVSVDSEELESLREENRELEAKIESMETSGEYEGMEESEIAEELNQKKLELESKEDEIKEKTEKINNLQEELNYKEEELEDIKEKMRYKEDELNDREEDLRHREELIKKERRELESLREEFGGTTEKERKRRLKDLEKEISQKEQQIKAKEKYIEQKERELRSREEDLIDEELEERQEEILQEIEQEKAKTGTPRLDDLMLGGIPLGSNVSVYGPPHVGKGVLINSFIAEGIEKGVPAIWVVTDKTIDAIREEMRFVLPTYEEYEKRGLVYYVDAYSVSMGEVEESERDKDHIYYIEEQSDLEAITSTVDKIAKELKEEYRYYRLSFQSVSTLIAYLDTTTTFRTLQPFAGRRKREKAVSLFTLEKGMHSEQDISMLGHMMDGEIEFKFQQLETYLRVEGLGDVQVRDWVKYTASKSGITMGSFSLDTIR